MKHPLFVVYGVAVIALASWAELSGWSFGGSSAARARPRTVRDNPGAFRPHYGGGYRYYGGK